MGLFVTIIYINPFVFGNNLDYSSSLRNVTDQTNKRETIIIYLKKKKKKKRHQAYPDRCEEQINN